MKASELIEKMAKEISEMVNKQQERVYIQKKIIEMILDNGFRLVQD